MDSLPLKKYDEVRLAINAIEMTNNHQWFITYYEGIPDLWNTKPPLLIWFQVFFIKLLGINEIAIRLPSAIAALTICFILYQFILLEFKKKWLASFTVLILISCNGFIHTHGARSGDYDTFLCLFLLIQSLSFYKFIQSNNTNYIVYFGIGIVFACLTKGITGLLFMPAFFIYILYEKKYYLLYNWKLILSFLLSIAIVLSYYLYRESIAIGFMKAVYENELGGRFLKPIEGHRHEWWFYFYYFFNTKFIPWYIILTLGLLIKKIETKSNHFVKYILLIVGCFVFVLSVAQTKIMWYDMPIYPLLSMVAAIGLYSIYELILQNRKSFALTFLFLIFLSTLSPMIYLCYHTRVSSSEKEDYHLCYYIKKNKSEIAKNKKVHFVYDGYNPQIKFYEYYIKDKFPQIHITKQIESGTTIYVSKKELKENLMRDYSLKLVDSVDNVTSYLVL